MNLSSTTLSTSTPNRVTSSIAVGEPVNVAQHHLQQQTVSNTQHDASLMTSSGTPPTPGFKFPPNGKSLYCTKCIASNNTNRQGRSHLS